MDISGHIDGCRVEALSDGNISLKFMEGDREVASVVITPAQVSQIVAVLLGVTSGAFLDSGKDPATMPISAPAPIPSTRMGLAKTSVRGRLALVVQAGDAAIAMTVEERELRSLARSLTKAFYRSDSPARSRTLLRDVFADFFVDLRGWGSVFKARAKVWTRNRVISLSLRISGRSLRLFRNIAVSPDISLPDYAPVGECIYCGSKIYSENPNDRRLPSISSQKDWTAN